MGSEWVEKTLVDICTVIKRGISPKYSEEGIVVLNQRCIRDQRITFHVARKHNLDIKSVPEDRILESNDVLINSTGVGTLGRVAQIKHLDELTTIDSHVTLVRLGLKSEIDNGFFGWIMKFNQSIFEAMGEGSTGQTELSRHRVGEVHIKYPKSKDLQKAIVHILDSLDDKIELNRQMNETLESMAQVLFKSWFVDFDPVIDNALAAGNAIPDVFADRAEQRRKKVLKSGGVSFKASKKTESDANAINQLFPEEFEYSEEMGWIPLGWGLSEVGVEFDVTMGQSPPGSSYNEEKKGISFFQGRADFGFRFPKNRIYCTEPKRFASKNDTLVSVRAPVGDVNMALEDCCIGRGVSAVRHKSKSRSFTYYSMLQLRSKFKKFEAEGTVFGSINQKDFKALNQLKTPASLVTMFEKNTGGLDSKIELNASQIQSLEKLRGTLLPKLLSGELRIPDAKKLIEESI